MKRDVVTEQPRAKTLSPTTCVQTLGLPFTSCVTFGRLFNLSVSWFFLIGMYSLGLWLGSIVIAEGDTRVFVCLVIKEYQVISGLAALTAWGWLVWVSYPEASCLLRGQECMISG